MNSEKELVSSVCEDQVVWFCRLRIQLTDSGKFTLLRQEEYPLQNFFIFLSSRLLQILSTRDGS